MNLPFKIDVPTFDVTLPSNGRVVKCRPYLVKEEKILLIAAESGETGDILNAISQIIQNCVLEDKFSVEDLPLVDTDYLFINLRAKAVGDTVDVEFRCNHLITENEASVMCNQNLLIPITLSNVGVVNKEKMSNKMMLGKIGVVLRYPTFKSSKLAEKAKTDLDKSIKIIASCIVDFYDDNQVFPTKDIPFEEVCSFVENLPTVEFAKLKKWIDNVPHLDIHVEKTCPKCGFQHDVHSEDVLSFF